MTNPEDRIHVKGDMSLTWCSYFTSTAGLLELEGNLTDRCGIRASGSHRFLFSGQKRQVISLPETACFAEVELQNHSKEGVYSETVFNRTSLIRNGCRLTYGELTGEFGWTLEEDTKWEGDLVLLDDVLDLNGHTLTIKGNLIQTAGEVRLNGGSLYVEGDYRIQSRTKADQTAVYGKSSGILHMTNEADYVCIEGSFITDSSTDHSSSLTAGTMEVKGDFAANSTYSPNNFVASGSHLLVICGTSGQKVSMGDSAPDRSHFASLEIRNESSEGVTFEGAPYVAVSLKDNGCKVSGSVGIGTDTKVFEESFTGDICIRQDTTLKGHLEIGGELYVENGATLYVLDDVEVMGSLHLGNQHTGNARDCGKLVMQKGSLTIGGNLTTEQETAYSAYYYSGITMTNPEDRIHVRGDMSLTWCSYFAPTAGLLELEGNLTDGCGIQASGSHRFLFSGQQRQEASLLPSTSFAVVELQNYSREGVHFSSPFFKTEFIRNNCRVTYGDEDIVCGYVLDADEIWEGDLILGDGTLDLNGHTLTVTGDFLQMAGNVDVNGGHLLIKGDYRIQYREEGIDAPAYSASLGQLFMRKEEDKVTVSGDFVMELRQGTAGNLTAGTLEIAGNYTQLGNYGYQASGSNTLVFNGSGSQSFMAAAATTVGGFINKNNNSLLLLSNITATGKVTDFYGTIGGTGILSVENPENITEGSYSGSLALIGNAILQNDLKIGGRLVLNKSLHIGGHTVYAQNMILNGFLYVEDGQIYITEDMDVNIWGRLVMQDKEGYVLVGDSFCISSNYDHTGLLTDGMLEIRGNFTQYTYKNFVASENHTVILSRKKTTSGRDYIQTISFGAYAGECRFHRLILKKGERGYLFTNDTALIADEIIYEAEDTDAPSAVKFLIVEHTTETTVILRYGGAEDNQGILGYEIYRDGIKVGVTGSTTFTDTNLKPGKTYQYQVYAFDADRNLALTSPETEAVTKEDIIAPTVPVDLSVYTKTGSSITLQWMPSSDNVQVAGYTVYRNGQAVAEEVENTVFRDENLEKNVTYHYSVSAYDTSGNLSGESELIQAYVSMPFITDVFPADGDSIGGKQAELSIRFPNVGNSTGNKVGIEYQDENGKWQKLVPYMFAQRIYDSRQFYVSYTWNLEGIEEESRTLRYTLYDADGNTDSREVTYFIDRKAPQIPEDFKAQSGNGTVKLSWQPSVSADCCGYVLYRCSGEADYELFARITDRYVTDYEDKQTEIDGSYYYAITAVDSFGNESAYSQTAQVIVEEDKEPPVIKDISPRAGRVNGTVSFDVTASDNKQMASILLQYREESAEEWTDIEEVLDTTFLPDGVYYVRAIAKDTSGNESDGTFVRRYEIDNTGISRIIPLKAQATATTLRLEWEDVTESDFAYFQVERLIGNVFMKEGTVSDKLGYDVEGLIPNTSYTFRIVGYDNLGNRGIPSEDVEIKTLEDNIAPVITAVYPTASCYKDCVALRVDARDNDAIHKAVFSYSLDGTNFNEIQTINAEGQKSSATLEYDFDISSLPEGNLYIKFQVYDRAGNRNALTAEGEEIIVTYRIDRTPPDKVENVSIAGNAGYVELRWDNFAQNNVHEYRIYRADAQNGIFAVIEEGCTTINYYDTTVKAGASYIYKIAAVDIAGNEGKCSEEIFVTVMRDTEAPVITGISPADGETVGADANISLLAIDNTGLASIKVEYRTARTQDEAWILMDEVEANDRSCLADIRWNTQGLEEGSYEVRAVASDIHGNLSDVLKVEYSLDKTAPALPDFQAQTGHFEVILHMEKLLKENDFDHYEIQRWDVKGASWQTIGRTKENTYIDSNVETDTIYLYRAGAFDQCGNSAWTEEVQGHADDVDVVAPTVSAPETIIGLVGMELAFDGMGSTDNVRITEYSWDMGNGDVLTGAQPRYAYDKAGTYQVTLTVSDKAGNTDSAVITVSIYDRTGKGAAKVQIVNEQGKGIPYALIYLKQDEDRHLSLRADGAGYVDIVAETGVYSMAAYHEGYLPADTEIRISEYETKEYALTLVKEELIVGNLTAHRMSLEEMKAAGIDLSNPSNYHTYTFNIEIIFEQRPIPIIIEYIGGADGNNGICYGGGGELPYFEFQCIGMASLSEEMQEAVEPIFAYIRTTESVTWLKDMYEVELGILNAADSQYVIEDAKAVLQLPVDKVSLADTRTGQSLTQDMGSIAGQERKSVSWFLRGEQRGSYTIAAAFNGILMPFETEVSAWFETEKKLDVTAGEGIHIYIMPEDAAYIGENYYILFRIANESDHPFYNLSTTIGAYSDSSKEYTMTDADTGEVGQAVRGILEMSDPDTMEQSVIVDGSCELHFDVFYPGAAFYGMYETVFQGNEEDDPDVVYYRLVDSLVSAIEGANLGVEVSVMPMSAHIQKAYYIQMEAPGFFGDPVDITTGYFTDELTPMSVMGAAPLSFDLSYNSAWAEKSGKMGHGWNHDYEAHLEEHNGIISFYPDPSYSICFVNKRALSRNLYATKEGKKTLLSEGEKYSYGEYQCLNKDLYNYCLTKLEDGTYTMEMSGGYGYTFDRQGRLASITDGEGKTTSLSYEGEKTVITEDISGKHLYLNHNESGYVSSVSDDMGRQSSFAYDEEGNLTAVTLPTGDTISYVYDENHRIIEESNALGTFVTNVYDETGRVTEQTDALGNRISAAYEQHGKGKKVSVTDAEGNTETSYVDSQERLYKVEGANGNVTEYSYDQQGNVVCEKDSLGAAIWKEYDAKGNLLKLTDKGGLVTVMTYDAKGNLSTITNASGQTATYDYNDRNQITASTDYNGLKTTYRYDRDGLLAEQNTEGLGCVTYTYDGGLVSSATDYNGNTTLFSYDGAGNLIRTTDSAGNSTDFAYDAMGRLICETDSHGNSTSYGYDCNGYRILETDALGNTTRYHYDAMGRMTDRQEADGTVTAYAYDSRGNCTRMQFPDGTYVENTYDGRGNLIQERLADGTKLTYAYDLLDQRISETDEEGSTISYEYYPNGNPYRTVYPDGSYELYTYNRAWKLIGVTDRQGRTVSYDYDSMGNLTLEQDALGNKHSYEYDRAGRCIRQTDANGNSTTYAYDGNSNCISMTNALGVTLSMDYDGLNRLKAVRMTDRDGIEYCVSYGYDALGRMTSFTDEEGNTTHYAYDALGRLTGTRDGMGPVSGAVSYDCMGRVARTEALSGAVTAYSYDAAGLLLKEATQTENGSRTTQYAYDELGRLTKVTDPLMGTTSMSYDARGNVAEITDANGGTTAYAYDAMNRLTSETSPLGGRRSYAYDEAGMFSESRNARGQKTAYTYDAAGRVTSMTDELGTVEYAYDRNGNLLTVKDGSGTITRKYDALNRVTRYTDSRGNTIQYAYDERGNLVSLTYPGGEKVEYGYYKNGLLRTVTDPEGGVTEYAYDARGNLTNTRRPNGTEELRTYDSAGRLAGLKDVRRKGPESPAEGTEDPAGTNMDAYEILSEYVYAYDESGNITSIQGNNTADTPEGLSRLSSAEMAYDEENRLISYNGEALRYDAEGNMTYGPVNGVMTELTYDCRNRLASAGGMRYTYDAENNRMTAETDEYIEEFVTDTASSSLSRVLTVTLRRKDGADAEEGTAQNSMQTFTSMGSITTLCVYGNGLISEFRGDIHLYHHYNHLGSTMKLTDEEGSTVATYAYGTYGELLSGNAGLTRFLYNGSCGVSMDANGLYYMRQRYYNPETKRFLNQDILTGSIGNSQSLNRYSYVQGNPVSSTDPFGLSPLNMMEGTGLIHGILGLLEWIPGPVGAVASFVDAGIYCFVDHDYGMALLSLASSVAMGIGTVANCIEGAAKTAKGTARTAAEVAKAAKIARTAEYARTAGTLISNTLTFATGGINLLQNSNNLYQKYKDGEKISIEDVATVALNAATCVLAGASMVKQANKLGKMMKEDNVVGRLKEALWHNKTPEVYYRTMSQADYDYLRMTGELPATKETFISPTYEYSSKYGGVTVEFELKNGTTNSLLEIGVGNNTNQAIQDYGVLPQVTKGWNEKYAFFKGERTQTNIGLGQGKALEIFNSNIISFKKVVGGN